MFLEVDKLRAGYGAVEVLHEVSLHVNEGEIVSILGANGAGKTTTLQTISGLATYMGGAIRLRGEAIHSLPSHQIVTRGLTQSPEGRRIFGALSVLENLGLGAFTVRDQATVEHTRDWIFELFPACTNAANNWRARCPGVNSRCWPLPAPSWPSPACCCWTNPRWGWPLCWSKPFSKPYARSTKAE